ncbi:kinase-like domain-containing protein [Mycena vulgaris]|nr:kinase-like domain-containing protein [Mycena vulgaris]
MLWVKERVGPFHSLPPRFANTAGSLQSQWTLEKVRKRVSEGIHVDYCVVDIGQDTLVKFGDHVSAEEGRATRFVVQWTSIPVARIYAILHDETTGVTYIVQEKLRGVPLMTLLPTLDVTARDTLASELKEILCELTKLDPRGPMGLFGRPSKYDGGILRKFSIPDPTWQRPTPDIKTPEDFLRWLPHQLQAVHGIAKPLPPDVFDFSRAPIFSHGDFVPENILIADGHVSGIVDWACAGWYPYF